MPIVQNICSPVGMQVPSKHELVSSSTDSEILRYIDKLPDNHRTCQICEFEGRGRKRKAVNMCSYHHIRGCTSQNPYSRLMKGLFLEKSLKSLMYNLWMHGCVQIRI